MKLNGVWLICGALVIVAAGIAPSVSAVPVSPWWEKYLPKPLAKVGCTLDMEGGHFLPNVICPDDVRTLKGVDLRDTRLSHALLYDVDLRGADLRDALLDYVDLSGANLSGANLSRAFLNFSDLSGANLSRADLSGADLTLVNLSGANLRGANLRRAYLNRANLSGANLRGANLKGAKWLVTTSPDGRTTSTGC
jgi:uncharacterized protein YjbI with pentapeptide repeats